MTPKRNHFRQYLFFLLISSFIVIVVWIGTNIYNKSVTSTIDQTLTVQTAPISSRFDQETVAELQKRKRIDPLQKVSGTPLSTPTPEISIEPESPLISPEAEDTALPTTTPVPSEIGGEQ